MNPALLLNHFDRISEAPDSVVRLRRFVLDFAVRGKLVEQDPSDEPASALLDRIRTERTRLENLGDIRKQGPSLPVGNGDMPFKVPDSWTWIRVADGFAYDAGIKREPKELLPTRWLLELEDIEKDTSRVITRLKVSDRGSLSTKSEFKVGDILYGKLRPYLNKVVVAREGGYSTTEIVAIRPFLPLCSDYCALAFRRPDFVEYVTRRGRGTKMPRLRTPDAVVALFPLPPIAEQHRIVGKVGELMTLCDRLEEAQNERERVRERLVTISLYQLSNSGYAEVFSGHTRFYLDQLPRLITRVEHSKQLRRTILTLAMQGKLAPQTPEDEPAALLLTRLQKELEDYAHEHKIAPERSEPIQETALPYAAPPGWTWTRLSNLFKVITDGDHQPPPRSTDGAAFLTIGNVTTGSIDFSNCRFVPDSYLEAVAPYRKPSRGDILYTVVGATYGRPVLVEIDRPFCVQRHIAILKPASEISTRFLFFMMASPLVYSQASKSTTGTAQPTIPLRPLRNFIVPLPPIAEQHRIVAKVDELMAICGKLELSLTTERTNSVRLLESLLQNALDPEMKGKADAA